MGRFHQFLTELSAGGNIMARYYRFMFYVFICIENVCCVFLLELRH